MKFLLAFSLLGMVFGCQQDEAEQPTAGVKLQAPAKVTPVEIPTNWHYAKYKFSLTGFEDLFAAVRVGVNDDNEAVKLELKDLTAGRESRVVEDAPLNGTKTGNAYNFEGISTLVDGGTDYGGNYTGSLTLSADGSVADCCGEITFTTKKDHQADDANNALTFTGEKMTETFGEAEWNTAVGASSPSPPVASTTCEDFKLVMSELKDVKRGEEFDLTVSLQNCDDEAVARAKDVVVKLQRTSDNGTTWHDSAHDGKKLDDTGSHEYAISFNIGEKKLQKRC